MLDKMCEDIWKFLQPKLDQKFNEVEAHIREMKAQLDRIEAQTKK